MQPFSSSLIIKSRHQKCQHYSFEIQQLPHFQQKNTWFLIQGEVPSGMHLELIRLTSGDLLFLLERQSPDNQDVDIFLHTGNKYSD